MIEMRREKRWPAKLNLEISNLFKQWKILMHRLR